MHALALLGAGFAVTGAFSAPAAAQDYTTGALVGTVVNPDGSRANAGTVSVTSQTQGFTRNATVSADGTFRIPALPAGTYNVKVSVAGQPDLEDDGIVINPGANNTYTFAVGSASGENNEILVLGTAVRGNDFGSNTGGLTISDVSELLNTTPIARNQTALILLSPGVNQGDTVFGNLASIGGATVAENAYYVNGLNVTNFRNFVGSNNPPIEFYQSLDVKLFGYSAEYGRALGGFTTTVTKSGSNDFSAGAVVAYSPDGVRSDSPDTYSAYNQTDFSEDLEANFYLSGPIIKDRLFFYGLYNPNYTKTADSSITGGLRTTATNSSPFYGGKLDFLIADGHRLEGTFFRNHSKTTRRYNRFDPTTFEVGDSIGTAVSESGGNNFVGSYTGQFTDWLTLSASYGQSHDDQAGYTVPETSYVASTRTGTSTIAHGTTTANYTDKDVRKFFRADGDIYATLLGSHHFRFGYEQENLTSTTDTRYAGGYRYNLTANYVQRYYYENVGTWHSKNQSFYIQDSWSLMNDRLNLQLGVRNDRFSNDALNGDTYFKSGSQWGPRLGASFDVFGDKRTAIRASWGRYFLPVASNTNIRLGGAELYYQQRFAYPTGVSSAVFDQYGLVSGLTFDNLGNIQGLTTPIGSSTDPCPTVGPDAGTNTCYSTTSDGILGPTDTLVSSSLQPSYSDEWTVGIQQRLGDWDLSVTYINRRLGRTLDDVAIDAAVLKYCDAKGIAGCDSVFSGFHQYVLANPGSDITVRLDGDCSIAGQCDVVTLAAADLGYPKAVRNYDSVQFQFSKAYRDGWALGGSYSFTRLRGNYEGAVKTEIGQDDAGLTQDFDQPGLLDGATGVLANQRAHAFKLFGTFEVANGFRLGFNALLESPRKFSCYGTHPTDFFAAIYQNASYYCRNAEFSGNTSIVTNHPGNALGQNGIVRYLVPRGTAFKSDWRRQIDVNVQYDIKDLPGSFVSMDVFNLFNFQSKLDYNEFGENADGTVNANYGDPISYQTPRYVRFTIGVRLGGKARD
nr:TonB-dependent receptor [Hephaestia sp. MAHUQ-44]